MVKRYFLSICRAKLVHDLLFCSEIAGKFANEQV